MNVNALNGTSFLGKNKLLTNKETLKRQRTAKQVAYNQAKRHAKAKITTNIEVPKAVNQAVRNVELSAESATKQTAAKIVNNNGSQLAETIKKTGNKKLIPYIAITATAAALAGNRIYLNNKNKNQNYVA